MTKNLFLLFCIYFFVVQAGIAGLLTGNSIFYQLGAINAGAILLISIFYAMFTNPTKDAENHNKKKIATPLPPENKSEKVSGTPLLKGGDPDTSGSGGSQVAEKQEEKKVDKPLAEKTTEKSSIQKIVPPTSTTATRRRKKGNGAGQRRILLITLIITVAINFIVWEFFTYRSPLLAIFAGFVLFLIIGKFLDIRGFAKTNRLLSTRIYYLLLLASIGYARAYFSDNEEIIEQYIPELRNQNPFQPQITTPPIQTNEQETSLTTGDYIYEWAGQVLSGDRQQLINTPENSTGTDIDTDNNTTDGPSTGTNQLSGGFTPIATGNETTPTENTPNIPTEIKNITMIEAIKHVIDQNNIPLSTKTNVTFSTMSTSNSNYSYFLTAYEKRMIGKNTEPNNQISCETYIVIKGIGAGRSVGNYSDIKDAYRKKAQELNQLNGCSKGGRVTTATL